LEKRFKKKGEGNVITREVTKKTRMERFSKHLHANLCFVERKDLVEVKEGRREREKERNEDTNQNTIPKLQHLQNQHFNQ